jgi:hypothetical protein
MLRSLCLLRPLCITTSCFTQVWGDCQVAGVPPDSRMCITYMEVCTRLGQIDRALQMYSQVGVVKRTILE